VVSFFKNDNESSASIKVGQFFDQLSDSQVQNDRI
jgi:hypothetical protein